VGETLDAPQVDGWTADERIPKNARVTLSRCCAVSSDCRLRAVRGLGEKERHCEQRAEEDTQ
jgi:hypothetical protein